MSINKDQHVLKNKAGWFLKNAYDGFDCLEMTSEINKAMRFSFVDAKINIDNLKNFGHEFTPVRLIILTCANEDL